MRTIIAGSRTIRDYQLVLDAVATCPWAERITEVVSGGAYGVDALGERFAAEFGVPCVRFPVTAAEWQEFGKMAGPRRNSDMARYAQPWGEQDTGGLIAVWDGRSRGTANMIKTAEYHCLAIHLWTAQ